MGSNSTQSPSVSHFFSLSYRPIKPHKHGRESGTQGCTVGYAGLPPSSPTGVGAAALEEISDNEYLFFQKLLILGETHTHTPKVMQQEKITDMFQMVEIRGSQATDRGSIAGILLRFAETPGGGCLSAPTLHQGYCKVWNEIVMIITSM